MRTRIKGNASPMYPMSWRCELSERSSRASVAVCPSACVSLGPVRLTILAQFYVTSSESACAKARAKKPVAKTNRRSLSMVRYILIAIVVLLILRIFLRRKQPPPMIEEIQMLDSTVEPRASLGAQGEVREAGDRPLGIDQNEREKKEDR